VCALQLAHKEVIPVVYCHSNDVLVRYCSRKDFVMVFCAELNAHLIDLLISCHHLCKDTALYYDCNFIGSNIFTLE
jgi:hypothetical protein